MEIRGQEGWTPSPRAASVEVWKVDRGWLMFLEAAALENHSLLPPAPAFNPTPAASSDQIQANSFNIFFNKIKYHHQMHTKGVSF